VYLVLLSRQNDEFQNATTRSSLHHRSHSLNAVLAALQACQQQAPNPSQAALTTLLDRLRDWQNQDPNEYAKRGSNMGIAYRLWMEAKQRLRNIFHVAYPGRNPNEPAHCPGDTVLGFYVPAAAGNPHMEICHGFSYRWLIAAGKLQEQGVAAHQPTFNADNMVGILFPPRNTGHPLPAKPRGHHRVRRNGALQVRPGDLIGFFAVDHREQIQFAHSLICKTNTRWFGANNAGCFGTVTGRTEVDPTRVRAGNTDYGWDVNGGNIWRTPTGTEYYVVYRRQFT